MASEKVQPQMEKTGSETEPCWKKKAASEGFLAKMKDHFDEFVNTPMNQHKICLKKTIDGVSSKFNFKKSGSIFGSSKTENDIGVEAAESSKQPTTTQ